MVGEKVIVGIQSNLQTSALIEQLKEMQAASPTKPRTYNEPSQTQQEAYQEVEQKMGKGAESIVEEMPIEQVMADLENNSLEIEEVLETKE
jgi:flagellar capping protein FliD